MGVLYTSKDRIDFYKKFMILVLPVMAQQFVNIALNLIDSIMVGKLGVEAIAAVSFINKLTFVYAVILYGVSSGIAIFIAQFFGKKDFESIYKLFGLIVIFSFAISSIFFIYGFFWAEHYLRIFSKDEEVIRLGIGFLKVIAISFLFTSISLSITATLRAMGQTLVPLYITLLATIVNTILNYALIYGNWGFPNLGVLGAGIATAIARAVEFICFIFIFMNHKYNLITSFKNYWGLPINLVKSLIKVCTPVLLTEVVWVLATTALTIAYAKLGTNAASAFSIGEVVVNISTIIFMGVANGSSILIAQSVGRGDMQESTWIAKQVIYIALFFSTLCSIFGFSIINPLLSFYTLTPEVRLLAKQVLIVLSFALFFKMLNWTIIIGILRGGGDTRFGFFLDTIILVGYAVPIAFMGSMVWQLSVYWVVLLANIEEVIKLFFAYGRYLSKKWMHNLTEK
jgi:putative MATE family efflux protein